MPRPPQHLLPSITRIACPSRQTGPPAASNAFTILPASSGRLDCSAIRQRRLLNSSNRRQDFCRSKENSSSRSLLCRQHRHFHRALTLQGSTATCFFRRAASTSSASSTASAPEPAPLSPGEYHRRADTYIDALVAQLEELQERREDVDVEYSVRAVAKSCYFVAYMTRLPKSHNIAISESYHIRLG
jgi:hypothetical protein